MLGDVSLRELADILVLATAQDVHVEGDVAQLIVEIFAKLLEQHGTSPRDLRVMLLKFAANFVFVGRALERKEMIFGEFTHQQWEQEFVTEVRTA